MNMESSSVINNFLLKFKNYNPQNYSNKMVYKNCSFAKIIFSIRLIKL